METLSDKFQKFVGQTSPFDPGLEVVSARGCYLHGSDGRTWLDFISGIAVTNVGHCHPAVTRAVVEQAKAYAHTMVYGEHVQRPQVELAQAIADVAPEGLNCVYFLTTGAEANDAALKLAVKHTGRRRFVAFDNAYHGDTIGALACFGSRHYRDQFPGVQADVEFLPFGDAAALQRIDDSIAAVLMEPVQGEAGIILPPAGYLQQVRQRCDEVGALLIFDEVQTGFGRIGDWFAARVYGVRPDVITMAKGLGAGYPLAGVLAERQMLFDFAAVPAFSHITTFGGHPVSCAAGLAGMQVIQSENLLENCCQRGQLLLESLREMQTQFPALVKAVRGIGLMLGVEMVDAETARAMVDQCREAGLILETTLLRENTVRFSPPLIVTEQECERALDIFQSTLRKQASGR